MSSDLLADLAALALDDEIHFDAWHTLEDELLRCFATSPEAAGLEPSSGCLYLMDLASDYFGETVATLDDAGLREILFELIPRKVSVDAAEAEGIVVEMRAFYRFLGREIRASTWTRRRASRRGPVPSEGQP
ncbi:MAG: hypothetical protein HC809_15810, partial [Gammaproteobacteria bacterium]|nr:hypothetical protein [Gammaproteobacteria bacterium]